MLYLNGFLIPLSNTWSSLDQHAFAAQIHKYIIYTIINKFKYIYFLHFRIINFPSLALLSFLINKLVAYVLCCMFSFCVCNLYFEFVISLVFVSACTISNLLMSDIVM